MGGLGDSYYEYLLKYWLLFSKKDEKMGKWYLDTANEIIKQLGHRSSDGMWWLAKKRDGHTIYEMEHLACFAGGMFALGSLHIEDEETRRLHLEVGEGIGRLCWEMYNISPIGLSPEVAYLRIINDKFNLSISESPHWLMRPEAIETWFILWRVTKKPIYRDYGWTIFKNIEKYSRTNFGYSGIRDVRKIPVHLDDVQQSYFLAETLKYLYLLFSSDKNLPLDEFVFNTEAHPLKIFKSLMN